MRKEGYYWIKYLNEWIIAEWNSLSKIFRISCDVGNIITESECDEIDEKTITRN